MVRRITILRKGLVKKVGWGGGYQGAGAVGEVSVKEQRLQSGPWKMPHLCKCEDLSSNPQYSYAELVTVACACHLL